MAFNRHSIQQQIMSFSFLMVVLQIVTGIALAYLALPPVAQANHILLASLLFGAQFYLLLNLFRSAEVTWRASMKFSDFSKLIKFRLTFLVVFSASISFIIAVKANGGNTWGSLYSSIMWINWIKLVIGGFLVTAAANSFNEVIEVDLDKLMKRTK